MKQRAEEMVAAEILTKTRSELNGLKERWRTLSSLLDMSNTGSRQWVCAVCVAIGDSLPLTEFYHVFSQLNTRTCRRAQLRGSHQYLGLKVWL